MAVSLCYHSSGRVFFESNEPIATGSICLAAACTSAWQVFVLQPVSMSSLRVGVLWLTLTAAMRPTHHETGRGEVEGDQLCCCHKTIPPVEICVKDMQVFEKKDLSWLFMWFHDFSKHISWITQKNNDQQCLKRFSTNKPTGFWGCFIGEATVVQCLNYGPWDLGAWGRSAKRNQLDQVFSATLLGRAGATQRARFGQSEIYGLLLHGVQAWGEERKKGKRCWWLSIVYRSEKRLLLWVLWRSGTQGLQEESIGSLLLLRRLPAMDAHEQVQPYWDR